MLLFIAFALFALLFLAWIMAPTSAPSRASEPATTSNVPETGTQPA